MQRANIKRTVRSLWRLTNLTITHFYATGCTYRAASLAYTSLLSLVPLMTICFAMLAIFPVFQKIQFHLQDFIFSNFVPATGSIVQGYLLSFVEKAGRLSLVSLLFLLFTAVTTMFNIERTFNAIWQVTKQRRLVTVTVLYVVVLTVSPLLLGTGFVLSTYLASLSVVAGSAKLLAPFLFTVITFMLIYTTVPHCHVPFKSALTGALVSAICFEATKHVFTLYVTRFADYALLYGTLAAIPVFLIWVYLCWVITLFGAVVSYALTHPRKVVHIQ